MPKTLLQKLWETHVVRHDSDGSAMLYIDLQLINEVTSPQAFEGLSAAGLNPWRSGTIIATSDHNVPTRDLALGIQDPVAKIQVQTLERNCADLNLRHFKMGDQRQGILHVIAPESGASLPGMTIVCGDSHTSTHGAFAAHEVGRAGRPVWSRLHRSARRELRLRLPYCKGSSALPWTCY